MISDWPTGFLYFAGAIFISIIPIRIGKQFVALTVPIIAFANLLYLNSGIYWTVPFLEYEIIFLRVDKLSLAFAYIFVAASFIATVYAIHIKDTRQHVAAFTYVGSTLGVTFCGDLFSLLVFWELMAVSSVFLIWLNNNKRSREAGFRYILVHLAGGGLLLAGIIIHVYTNHSIQFSVLDFGDLGSKLILVGFLINAAVPPLHAWLSDAYPEGTVTGSVYLSAFTTKSAVYVLARSFSGLELLMWLGAIMTLYGVFYAMLQNDIRRLLSYHIISQVGYMVCGVGIGTTMAISGAVAHAFCHILYKALLFMGTGSVIHVVGSRKISDLEGNSLYRKMPITLSLYMIGAFSISAVPLFNGFVSKTVVVAAAGKANQPIVELMLHLASVGTFLSVGLKLPWGTWFGERKSNIKEKDGHEPPINMILGMTLAAIPCIVIGVYPKVLYDIMPFKIDFNAYEPSHVVITLQLLLFTCAGFAIFLKQIKGKDKITVDTDWFYRKAAGQFIRICEGPMIGLFNLFQTLFSNLVEILKKQQSIPIFFSRHISYFAHSIKAAPSVKRPIYDRVPIGVGILSSIGVFCILLFVSSFIF